MSVKKAEFVKSGTTLEHFPEELPEIAFCGRSNVGKSSLLNSLMYRKNLVKVSSTPGHTRLLNWFRVNDSILFCDLPGYGFAKVPPQERQKWGVMINSYLQHRECLLALVIIVDVRRGFQEDDLALMAACTNFQLQPILVASKCDKLKRNELMNQKMRICKEAGLDPSADVIWYSSETHQGRDQLWRRIQAMLPKNDEAAVAQAENDRIEYEAEEALREEAEAAEAARLEDETKA